MNNEHLKSLKNMANRLPLAPGVYIMYSKSGEIIYVGKAKQLKNRVTQYFGAGNEHTQKVKMMVQNVDRFRYIVCDSEFEAFILENSLIKKHQPKYNILLKDDKGYFYVKITDDKWRKIVAVKQKGEDGKYIGPYNSFAVVRETVDEALKVFKLPQCNRSFDKPTKPCLNFHLGICSAPCKNKINLESYNEQIDSAVAFIKKGGYNQNDLLELTKKMNIAAENLDFEYAAKLRDRIAYIKRISEKQKVVYQNNLDQDVICSIVSSENIGFQVLSFKNGRLSDSYFANFEFEAKKQEMYSQFVSRYYESKNEIPSKILFDEEFEDKEHLKKWLSEKKGKNVEVLIPQKGELKKLTELCKTNAVENLSKILERSSNELKVLDELANLIGLKNPPEYIESYDISNTQGSFNVAGMVVFQNGKPLKSAYRKFKIKSFLGQDDFKSMEEVIRRRLSEYKKGEDSDFKKLPDLILIDGGKGQLGAVLPVLQEFGVNIPVYGMVKNSKHRTKALIGLNGEIEIKPTKAVYNLITRIQDETHRFAITYHQSKRSKAMLGSSLLQINGIGPEKAKNLIKHFKTVTAIKNAPKEELLLVQGISENVAENIIEYFKK